MRTNFRMVTVRGQDEMQLLLLPLLGWLVVIDGLSHDWRRGLHSFAASRLSERSHAQL